MTLGKAEEGAPGSSSTAGAIAFRLDPRSGVPTYLQLVQQVEHALLLGYLAPGDQLPKVRDVVAKLAINPNTVLEGVSGAGEQGARRGRPGQGTFVEATLTRSRFPSSPSCGARSCLGRGSRRGRVRRRRHGGVVRERAAGISGAPGRQAAARRVASRRGGSSHERHRDARPRQAVRRTWALQDCTLAIPSGRRRARRPERGGQVHVAQPGGRTHHADAGEVTVLGGVPAGSLPALDGIAFVAQDMPLYRSSPSQTWST